MKFACALIIACLMNLCGIDDYALVEPLVADVCDEGQACLRASADAGSRAGTCRRYDSALVCCDGCWDVYLQFCQPGTVQGECGIGGEECAPGMCK